MSRPSWKQGENASLCRAVKIFRAASPGSLAKNAPDEGDPIRPLRYGASITGYGGGRRGVRVAQDHFSRAGDNPLISSLRGDRRLPETTLIQRCFLGV